jgi:hypothetical protein
VQFRATLNMVAIVGEMEEEGNYVIKHRETIAE